MLRAEPGSVVSAIRMYAIAYCTKWAETVAFYREVLALGELFSNGWFVEVASGASLSVADAERTTIDAVDGGGITPPTVVDRRVGTALGFRVRIVRERDA